MRKTNVRFSMLVEKIFFVHCFSDVWPTEKTFGYENISTDEELKLLREIFLTSNMQSKTSTNDKRSTKTYSISDLLPESSDESEEEEEKEEEEEIQEEKDEIETIEREEEFDFRKFVSRFVFLSASIFC